jgi:phage gpG-like protein
VTGATIEIAVSEGRGGEALQRLADRAIQFADPLAEIGELLVASTQDRFNQAVAPDGTPWAPLAASTLARKKGPGILRENLHLQGSMRYQVGSDELQVGTNLPYAAAQHFGLPARIIRPKNGKALFWSGAKHPVREVKHPGLKARPILGLSAEDEVRIVEILEDYLLGD